MAEQDHHKSHESETPVVGGGAAVETKDRGLFDFMGKKEEEKPQEEVIVTEFEEKVQVSDPEPKEEENKHGLLEKLHRSDSSTSSVSINFDHIRRSRGKKGFLEKIKEKLPGQQKKAEEETLPAPPPAENAHAEAASHEGDAKEKKGILEKIKEKIPGYHPKTEEEKKE
ncbi:hypothetical protein GH714_007087 [Hevea brasiliensis]|uniref:Dehydrin n=1 Tax=Hevea brasiliensis TaxID=3981 RepID=A0A6A6M917_HEVBR|nr:hypothetical protein GH714_007087 [Hevea brasiliensis]